MSKILYYSACGLVAPHIGVTIDDILSRKKEDDEIYWCYCHKAISSCFGNLNGCSSICSFCHSMYKRYGKKYGKGVHMVPIDKNGFVHGQRYSWSFESVDQIKNIVYRDVYIGYSILSLYFSYTKDLDLKNITLLRQYIKPLIDEICDFVDYSYELIQQIHPDEIVSFNGRFFDNRLFYDIANVLAIKYISLEVIGGYGDPFKKVSFNGGLPHSIQVNTQRIEDLWRKSPLSDKKKSEIASSFYTRRRAGILVADNAVYTSAQKQGVLPQGFNHTHKNIAIFNSSPDEFEAVGGEWEENIVFFSQFDAIEYLLKNSNPEVHYYLRIHPHLKNVDYIAYKDLYKLCIYPNLTIIPPESNVSTYSLMDACEKVITFGSTMGVEATYWGKPSVLIGRAMYEKLNVCYSVSDKDEIIPLLERKLTPKPQIGSLKYAYYLLDTEYGVDSNSIDVNVKFKTLRWRFQFTSYFKIWGSQVLFQIAYFYYCVLMPRFSKSSLEFPR